MNFFALQARDVDVASVYAKDAAYDSLSPGISPRTPLEFFRDSGHPASPLTPISNSETSGSMQAWWVALLSKRAQLQETLLYPADVAHAKDRACQASTCSIL